MGTLQGGNVFNRITLTLLGSRAGQNNCLEPHCAHSGGQPAQHRVFPGPTQDPRVRLPAEPPVTTRSSLPPPPTVKRVGSAHGTVQRLGLEGRLCWSRPALHPARVRLFPEATVRPSGPRGNCARRRGHPEPAPGEPLCLPNQHCQT